MTQLEVLHHTRNIDPFVFDPNLDIPLIKAVGFKPTGMWLSVDDDWRRWCTDEQWGDAWFQQDPIPFLLDTERCIWLKTVEEMDEFTKKYGVIEMFDGRPYYVDWSHVREDYAGIIIAPYQWERRLGGECPWYYPWDCASACVWDMSVLTQVEVKVS